VLGGRSESATIPAPACSRATPSSSTTVRIAMQVSSVPSGSGIRLRPRRRRAGGPRAPRSAASRAPSEHRRPCPRGRSRAAGEGVTSGRSSRRLGHEVRHVREALPARAGARRAPCRYAHAREVVAAEVDEHHVLGPILLRGEQPLRIAFTRLGRSGDRVQARPPASSLTSVSATSRRAPAVELEQEQVRDGLTRRSARRARAASPTSDARRVGRGRSGTPHRGGSPPWQRAPSARTCPDRAPAASGPPVSGSGRARSGAANRSASSSASPARTSATPLAWSKRTSVSAITNRLSGSPDPSRAAAPSARAWRRSRRPGSRQRARRRPRPRSRRRAVSRDRRTSGGRVAHARPTRGERRRARPRGAGGRRERRDQVGDDVGGHERVRTKKTTRRGRRESETVLFLRG